MTVSAVETGICIVCGRKFSRRRNGERDWEEVRYCSERCHARRLLPSDYRLEAAIEHLLNLRERDTGRATLDPAEAARFVDRLGWRSLMEATRMAARRLATADRLEFVQEGRAVDPSAALGPVLLRRKRRG